MHGMPPLNALRAFEAAARHLSLTKAAAELHVTPGALSHQIRALEEMLGMKLFERRVRAIALTAAGRQLYPGLQTGFGHIREALAGLDPIRDENVLVVSTSPGLTSKWLAPRLYRFAEAHPEIEVRISSSLNNANFATDGIDVAVRNMPVNPVPDPMLASEKLVDLSLVPVCSPKLMERYKLDGRPEALARAPLIHDDTLAQRISVPTWADWFRAAGISADHLGRGLRFNSADHALDAAAEGAGVLLALDLLAYDDLRTGRLVVPVPLFLPAHRTFHVVWPKQPARGRAKRGKDLATPRSQIEAFRTWIKKELAALDWRPLHERRKRPSVR
jgi:LysR family glycine cleavage system transcriptional activator